MTVVYLQLPLFVREIPLTKGLIALVDADLYPILAQHRWHVSKGYAVRHIGGRKNRSNVSMHHEVLRLRGRDVPSGMDTDHINRDRCDNRSENLRIVPRWVNCHNIAMRKNNTSGYRGVYWDNSRSRWCAHFNVRGRQRHVGYYSTAHEAAAAWQDARLSLGLPIAD